MVLVTDPRQFPLGCRFHPTDNEILNYLQKGVDGLQDDDWRIPEVNIRHYDPWELSGIFHGNPIISWDSEVQEGWFFSPYKAKKAGRSIRGERSTPHGSWHKTGNSEDVKGTNTGTANGTRKILVFYRRKNKKKKKHKDAGKDKDKDAVKTDWVIHEYHPPGNAPGTHVLCRLKLKRDKVDKSTRESEYLAEFALYFDQTDCEESIDKDLLQAKMNSLRESIHPENRGEFLQQPRPAPGSQNNRLPSDIHQLTNTLGPSVMDMLFENDLTDGDIQLMFGTGEEDEDVRDIENADHAHADFPDNLMLTEDVLMNQRARTTDSVRGFVPVEEKKGVVEHKFNGSPFASEKPMPRPVTVAPRIKPERISLDETAARAKVQGYKERGSAGNSTKKTNSKKIGYAKQKSNSVAASTGTTSESTKTSTNPPLANQVNVLIGIFLLLNITRLVFNF